MSGRIRQDVDELTYHADPSFSYSQAKTLLVSPAKYRWGLTHRRPDKAAFDEGHAVHAKVLGVGLDIAVIPDEILASNGATNTAKAKVFIAEARERGAVPVKSDVAARVDAMAEAVLANDAARAAFEAEGDVELSMWWTDPESLVECRGRIDKAATTDTGISLVDLKSTNDGSPRAFSSTAAKYGYGLQGGTYCDGWELITGEAPTGFLFVTVETEAPHLVATYSLSPWDVQAGRERWREACARLARYRAEDHWPAYATDLPDFAPLDLPAWAV